MQDLASPIKWVGSGIIWWRPMWEVSGSNIFPWLFWKPFSHQFVDLQLKSPVIVTQKGFSAGILESMDSKLKVNSEIQSDFDLDFCKQQQRNIFFFLVVPRIQHIQGGSINGNCRLQKDDFLYIVPRHFFTFWGWLFLIKCIHPMKVYFLQPCCQHWLQ